MPPPPRQPKPTLVPEETYPYVLYVTISTGIGTALVINGQPYRGRAGSLEAGHMIIDPEGPVCGAADAGTLRR